MENKSSKKGLLYIAAIFCFLSAGWVFLGCFLGDYVNSDGEWVTFEDNLKISSILLVAGLVLLFINSIRK